MKKLVASVLLLSLTSGLASCGTGEPQGTADFSGAFYSHGEEGYFSMLDEGYPVPVRDQGPLGRCCAFACSAAVQRNILYTLGEDVDIDPADVIVDCMGVDKTEGIRLTAESYYGTAISNPEYIEISMANGYNGYTLVAAPTYNGLPADETTRELIQEAIRTYGGVTATMQISTPQVNGWHGGYYTVYDGGESMNHVVNIIGYDDNFPAECFDGHVTTDGAWLVQNSFGEEWGNEGYFWLSYESTIGFCDAFQMSNRYSEVISYAPGITGSIYVGEDTTVGSVYEHSGSIGGVGTILGWYMAENGSLAIRYEPVSVTVEIRTADFSEVIYSQDATFDMGGYYVVEFDTPVEVDGQFAVVVTYHDNNFAPVEGPSLEEFGLQTEYIASCNEGDSFIRLDDQWLDMADPATSEYLFTSLIEDGIIPPDINDPAVAESMSQPLTDPYINVLFV